MIEKDIGSAAGQALDPGRVLGAGSRIGAFETQAVIAESATSIVYLANDRALERQVAVKEYVPRDIARRDTGGRLVALPGHIEALRRGVRAFHAAARTLAHVDHPASARVLLLWEANATAYLAMPYYPGTPLLELRGGMRAAPDEAALRALLDGLLGALDAYHRRDSIHGAVSPSKILLLPDDTPLLLGAGASTRLAGAALLPGSSAAAFFAPPEQSAPSAGAPLGPWTDFYALAGVLRFCISGELPRAPVKGAQPFAADPSVHESAQQPDYSAALVETLDAALSPDWTERPQSAQQFREWLRSTRSGSISAAVATGAGRVLQSTAGVATVPQPAVGLPQRTGRPPTGAAVADSARDSARAGGVRHAAPPAEAKRGPGPPELPIEPVFDAASSRAPAVDAAAEAVRGFAWNAAPDGRARRRREALFGWILLIVLALAAVLFATSAWTSWVPAHIDMDAASLLKLLRGAGSGTMAPAAGVQPEIDAQPASAAQPGIDSGASSRSPAPAPDNAGSNAVATSPDPPQTAPAVSAGAALGVTPTVGAQAPLAQSHPTMPAPRSPREACSDRSQFALYRCMQTQCETPLWHGHAQCQRLRETDRVD